MRNQVHRPHFWRGILAGFCRLNQIQFAAPWRKSEARC